MYDGFTYTNVFTKQMCLRIVQRSRDLVRCYIMYIYMKSHMLCVFVNLYTYTCTDTLWYDIWRYIYWYGYICTNIHVVQRSYDHLWLCPELYYVYFTCICMCVCACKLKCMHIYLYYRIIYARVHIHAGRYYLWSCPVLHYVCVYVCVCVKKFVYTCTLILYDTCMCVHVWNNMYIYMRICI